MTRSLGRRGVPAFAPGTKGSFVSYSRWHRAAPAAWGEDPTPTTLTDYLAKLPVDRLVVIPSTDEWALAVARLPPALAAASRRACHRSRASTPSSTRGGLPHCCGSWPFRARAPSVLVPGTTGPRSRTRPSRTRS